MDGKGSATTEEYRCFPPKQEHPENRVKISMDGKGRATDNAITERFFRNLKWEKIYYEEYRKPQEVYRAVRDYIDEYNFVRPHQAIGYEKPVTLYFGQARSSKTPLTIA